MCVVRMYVVCMCVCVCVLCVCGVDCGVCTSTEHFVLSSYLGMNINQFGLLEGAN